MWHWYRALKLATFKVKKSRYIFFQQLDSSPMYNFPITVLSIKIINPVVLEEEVIWEVQMLKQILVE